MDELLHKTGTKHILRLLISARENDPVFQQIWRDHQGEYRQMFKEATDQESDWGDYLFRDGSMIGLNAPILKSFLYYICDESMINIDIEPLGLAPKSNPLPWMKGWMSSDNVQPAPQETELSSYLVGQIDSDLDDVKESDWDSF